MATINVPAEKIAPGPMGYRVQIVDYDATRRVYHGQYDLPAGVRDEPNAWRNGDPSIERDFRFHAQNTYGLVMKTLARFEFALGRRIKWKFHPHQIKVAPHGMADANAFYSSSPRDWSLAILRVFPARKFSLACRTTSLCTRRRTHC